MKSHLGLGRQNTDFPYSWQELDGSYRIDRPTLLILGGFRTTCPQIANGYAKIFSRFMNLENQSGIDVVSAYYRNFTPGTLSMQLFTCEQKMADSKRYRQCYREKWNQCCQEENFSPNFISELFLNCFLPLVSQNNGTERLTLTEAKYRMRNLNIVTHSFGGYVVLMIEKMLAEKMTELGYTPSEQKDIQKQMAVVALAPPYGLGLSRSTTLSVASVTGDNLFTEGMAGTFNNFLKSVSTEYLKSDGSPNLALVELSGTESVMGIYTDGNVKNKAGQDEHAIYYFTNQDEVFTKIIRCRLEGCLVNSIKNASSYCDFIDLPRLEDSYVRYGGLDLPSIQRLPDYPERLRFELFKSNMLLPRYNSSRQKNRSLQERIAAYIYE
ncbi:MAG: hypothetical protein IJV07_02545 [Alphaproteobacteria bacterium]|nr:hypothetical protein [Alphaproteobacteria bacterium]